MYHIDGLCVISETFYTFQNSGRFLLQKEQGCFDKVRDFLVGFCPQLSFFYRENWQNSFYSNVKHFETKFRPSENDLWMIFWIKSLELYDYPGFWLGVNRTQKFNCFFFIAGRSRYRMFIVLECKNFFWMNFNFSQFKRIFFQKVHVAFLQSMSQLTCRKFINSLFIVLFRALET